MRKQYHIHGCRQKIYQRGTNSIITSEILEFLGQHELFKTVALDFIIFLCFRLYLVDTAFFFTTFYHFIKLI